MTVQTLFEDVSALGFENSAEITEAFLYAARRAQRTVAIEWGRETIARVLVPGSDTVSTVSLVKHSPGETIKYKAGGATAYSMKLSGKGSYTVRDGEGETAYEFNSKHLVRRGFIGEEGEIVFHGDSGFTVFDLAFFMIPKSAGEEAIPVYDKETEHHLPDLIDDYLTATAEPTNSDGERIAGARISGDTLTLPSDYFGEVNVFYKRLPREIPYSSTASVDVPRVAEHLLPLLTAAYLWLEDSPEKAQYYMQIYREETSWTRKRLPEVVGGEYGNVTGWA